MRATTLEDSSELNPQCPAWNRLLVQYFCDGSSPKFLGTKAKKRPDEISATSGAYFIVRILVPLNVNRTNVISNRWTFSSNRALLNDVHGAGCL